MPNNLILNLKSQFEVVLRALEVTSIIISIYTLPTTGKRKKRIYGVFEGFLDLNTPQIRRKHDTSRDFVSFLRYPWVAEKEKNHKICLLCCWAVWRNTFKKSTSIGSSLLLLNLGYVTSVKIRRSKCNTWPNHKREQNLQKSLYLHCWNIAVFLLPTRS